MSKKVEDVLFDQDKNLRDVTYDFDDEHARLMEGLEILDMVREEVLDVSEEISKIFLEASGVKVDDSLKLAAIIFRYQRLEPKIKMASKLMDYSLKDIYEVAGKTGDIKEYYWDEHVRKGDE